MKIREFARLTGMTEHTLRYYEKLGLLHVERDASGHRHYSHRDVRWARCVKRLKGMDMPLKDIQIFAGMRHHCCGPDCERLKVLERHKARLEELHREILEHIDLIDHEILAFKVHNELLKPVFRMVSPSEYPGKNFSCLRTKN